MSFWDKMRTGASKAADVAQKQATATRLGMQIDDTKTEIRRKTAAMGKLALELVRNGELTQPALRNLAQEIATLETQIVDLQAQVAAARGSSSPSTTAAE